MPRGFMGDALDAILPLSAGARERRFNDAAKAAGFTVARPNDGNPNPILIKPGTPRSMAEIGNNPKRAKTIGPRAQTAAVRG